MSSQQAVNQCITDQDVHVELTNKSLDAVAVMNQVKCSRAGAIVLFAGMPFLCRDLIRIKSDLLLQEQLEITLTGSQSRSFNILHMCL